MKKSEAAVLLTIAAAHDNRTIARSTAEVWAETLGDIRLVDARQAVMKFFATPGHGYLDASDVIQMVAKIRSDRLLGVEKPDPPHELDDEPSRAIEWQRVFRDGICDGAEREHAIECANQALDVRLDDEPLAIDSVLGKQFREQFDAQVLEISRAKSVAESERRAKAEALRQFKAERKASEQALTEGEPA